MPYQPIRFAGASLAVISFCLSTGAYAHGNVSCSTPTTDWKPQMELQKKLIDAGWKIRKVQEYHGCYEVYGFDDKGARVEAFFNPKSFERVEPDPEEPKK